MKTELNTGKAIQLYESLTGTHTSEEWIKIIIKIMAFLLARYIDGK